MINQYNTENEFKHLHSHPLHLKFTVMVYKKELMMFKSLILLEEGSNALNR